MPYILEMTAESMSSGRAAGLNTNGESFKNIVHVEQGHRDTMQSEWFWGVHTAVFTFSSELLSRIKSSILNKDYHIDSISIWLGQSASDSNFNVDLTLSNRYVQSGVHLPGHDDASGAYIELSSTLKDYIISSAESSAFELRVSLKPNPENVPSGDGTAEGSYISFSFPRIRIIYREKYSTITLDSDSIEFGDTINATLNVLIPTNYHEVTFKLGSITNTAQYAAGVTALTFPVPLSMATEVPNSTIADAVISAKTYSSGGTLIGQTEVHCTVTVPSNIVPTISAMTWSVTNALQMPLTNQALTISIQAAGAYGSTVNYTIEAEGYVSSSTALTIEKVARISSGSSQYRTITATAVATDSRGRSAIRTLDIDVCEWDFPYITTMEIYRCNQMGEKSEDGHYIYVRGAYDCFPVDNQNSVQSCNMTIVARSTGARTDAGSLAVNTAKIIGGGQLLSDEEYSVEFAITDNVATIVYNRTIYSNLFIVHFKHGGTGVAFGQAATDDDTVQISPLWKLLVGNNVDVAAKLADLESRIEALEGN